MKRFKIIALLTALVVAGLLCCVWFFRQPETPFEPADLSAVPNLQVGDWVLRMGVETDSRIIRKMGGGEYSHIGMIVAVNPEIMIVHATTGEPRQTPSDGVLITPLSHFAASDRAEKYAIIRPQFLNETEKQTVADNLMKKVGKPFVLTEKNKPHLYCTTLIADEIQSVYPNFAPSWQYQNTPVFKGEYLFPNAFVGYPNTQMVYVSEQ